MRKGLEIKQLTVATKDGKQIIKNISLHFSDQTNYALLGHNGCGKTTLVSAIMGSPEYRVVSGQIRLDGTDITDLPPNERAKLGIFLAMQSPVEAPGVTVANFLRTAKTAVDGHAPKVRQWVGQVNEAMKNLRMDPAFSQRDVNTGFSGGEKKRFEILQMELLRPRFAVLDETDSGLDIDALRIVSEGVNRLHDDSEAGFLLITHYTRILRYIKPSHVHVFVAGHVAEEGGPDLAERLEQEGYDRFLS